MNFKSFIFVIVGVLTPFISKSQISIYVGEGLGSYQFYQGELTNIAWEFNNHTGITKEMNPNRSFNGLAFGTNVNAGRFNFGIDWTRKKNKFGGEYEVGAIKVTDNYIESLNSFYLNFGIGNKIDFSSIKEDKKIVWRVQTDIGLYKFRIKEELTGSPNDFNEILGERKEISLRLAFNAWFPITKKLRFNVMPYYELNTSGGYVELLIDKTYDNQLYNINHFGVNLNLDYAF